MPKQVTVSVALWRAMTQALHTAAAYLEKPELYDRQEALRDVLAAEMMMIAASGAAARKAKP